MILHKDQFPVTIQAYELTGDKEFFLAEQVVNSQAEVDAFSNKYSGKLIKAKNIATTSNDKTTTRTTTRKSSAVPVIIVVLIILAILIAIGFYTGWIQRTTGISL